MMMDLPVYCLNASTLTGLTAHSQARTTIALINNPQPVIREILKQKIAQERYHEIICSVSSFS